MKNRRLTEEAFIEKNYELRRRFLEIFPRLGFGHLTTAFSETEFLSYLYYNVIDPEKDAVVLSKGHGAGMFYPIFEDLGMIGRDYLDGHLKIGGDISELKALVLPGFDFYGGSLGMGLGFAAGLAAGRKKQGAAGRVYCVVGDAECYEGSIWEAAMFSGHNRLDNLAVILDRNRLGCSDFTEHMLGLEPLGLKWEAMNWDVMEIDGHDYGELGRAFEAAGAGREKPLCIIADTVKGAGLPSVSGIPLMHGYMPDPEKAQELLPELQKVRIRTAMEGTG